MIHFACPHCRVALRAEDDKVGRKTRCPKCRSPVRVPTPERDGLPPPAVEQVPSAANANNAAAAEEQQKANQRIGLLMLGLFISGLICGTVLFVVLFIKIKEARLSRPVHGKQSLESRATGAALFPEPRSQRDPSLLVRRGSQKSPSANRREALDYSVQPCRNSGLINFSASEQFVTRIFGPSHSSFLPTRMATLPRRIVSVSSAA